MGPHYYQIEAHGSQHELNPEHWQLSSKRILQQSLSILHSTCLYQNYRTGQIAVKQELMWVYK